RYMSPFKLYLGVTTIFFLILFLPSTFQNFQQRLHDTGSTKSGSKNNAATGSANSPALRPSKLPGTDRPYTIGFSVDDKKGGKKKSKIDSDANNIEDITIFGETKLFTPKDLRGNQLVTPGHLVDAYDAWRQDPRNPHPLRGIKHVIV